MADDRTGRRLADLTSIRLGGEPTRLVEATETDALVRTLHEVWADGDDWLALGGGTNVVAADDGVDVTVVRIATAGIRPEPTADGRVRLHVAAGEPWDAVVAFAVERGWSGIEAMSGIPGTAGAAPVQNIGAYGQEVSDVLESIVLVDYPDGEPTVVPAADLALGYRSSALKSGERIGVVLGITLLLTDAGAASSSAPVRYSQLAGALGVALGASAPLADVRATVLRLRAGKGMALDPADPDSTSAGSFFMNPLVGERFALGLPADAPRYPVVEDDEVELVLPLGSDVLPPLDQLGQVADRSEPQVKLSAAWLIERAGVPKGFRLPGSTAAVSSKHTLAIVNTAGADGRAADVAELARYIQARVAAEFGVILQPEPLLLALPL